MVNQNLPRDAGDRDSMTGVRICTAYACHQPGLFRQLVEFDLKGTI
jgi:hypothetical protein